MANGLEEKLDNWESPHFIVKDSNLFGLKTLWRMSLHATNPQVAQMSGDYLNGIYEKVNAYFYIQPFQLCFELRKVRKRLFEEFINIIMTQIDKAYNNDKNEVILDRCISLLQVDG